MMRPPTPATAAPRQAAAPRLSHQSERGAAVYVVVLVITLLTSIGIFGARSASLNTMAAGYDRQATQTHYLTEYAVGATVGELSVPGKSEAYLKQANKKLDKCESVSTAKGLDVTEGANLACYKFLAPELDAQTQARYSRPLVEPVVVDGNGDVTEAGSFGPANVSAHFMVEMTDPGPVGKPVAGFNVDQKQMAFFSTTLNATGQVHLGAATDVCSEVTSSSVGIESGRAHVRVGPMVPP